MPFKKDQYDFDVSRDEIYDQCKQWPIIDPQRDDKIKYILKHNKENIFSNADAKYNDFASQVSCYEIKNMLLVGFDELSFTNKYGQNKDHRGSNHCNVYLPMHINVCMR
uniref:Uncharacterized protein n=1 Tax=viral metagenome TaxID=1070528 RepID=A0A6C0C8V8_9ZZZZ